LHPVPPAMLVDPDLHDLVPLRVQRGEDRAGGYHRHLVLGRATPEHQGHPSLPSGTGHAFSSPWRKSPIRSSASSPPTATLISPSPIPAASRSSFGTWRWLVVAG